MKRPHESISALARFSLSTVEREIAEALLAQVGDWPSWLGEVERHGVSGFISKHISEQRLSVPVDIKLSLKALNIRHKAAAKARHTTLVQIDQEFSKRNISFVALKGAALMPYIYKEPALRPMRDMDLLMPLPDLQSGAAALRAIGFDLPDEQPTKFMRDMHQLPNATKTVNGFLSSVELHNDGISREVVGHFYYPKSDEKIQHIEWDGLRFKALDDVSMLHQVTRHLEGLHNGALLKLINVMDVVGLSLLVEEKGQWPELARRYPHVVNTLRCLHLYTPLPESLAVKLAPLSSKRIKGVGEIMGSLRNALLPKRAARERLQLLFNPSDWWLYLYYNVDPNSSLWWVKTVRHPLRVLNWLSRRVYSGLLGG